MAHSKIEGEKLHIALQRLREKGDAPGLDALTEFEALLSQSSEGTSNHSSIEARLVDYIMPLVKDGSIFQENNTIRLLEYLRDEIIPQWTESPEMTRLATRVINDEITRYSELRERRQAGIAA
jgi:hypothetical protein